MIEDRLTFDDDDAAPVPVPSPAPVPVVVTPRASSVVDKVLLHGPRVMVVLLSIVVGLLVWKDRHPSPAPAPIPVPTPTVDATKDGSAWAKELPLTFADSFAQAQADVRGSDKPLDAIRKEHVERWKTSRDAAFNKRFVPLLDQVIPPGNDKPTMEDRRRYAEVMGQIVDGVREGAK